MKFPNFTHPRQWGVLGFAAALLAATAAAPAIAGPTTLTFSGGVDQVTNLTDPSFPLSTGDSLSGTVQVNANADGGFTLDDLQSFDLLIGSTEFNLDSSAFASFSGDLSADGSSLADFELATFFGANGLALGFNGVNQPFSVTSSLGAIAEGGFTVAVSGGGAVGVPEPAGWLWFGLGLAAIGFAMHRRRHASDRLN